MAVAKTCGVTKQGSRCRGQHKDFGWEEEEREKEVAGRRHRKMVFFFRGGWGLSMFNAGRIGPVMREEQKIQVREEVIKRMRVPRMKKK